MEQTIHLLDAVVLTQDLPHKGLKRGQVGAVVEKLAPDAYEVEFVDPNGATYATLPLRSEQILVLRYEPVLAGA